MYEPKVGMMSLFRSVVAEIFKKMTEQKCTVELGYKILRS